MEKIINLLKTYKTESEEEKTVLSKMLKLIEQHNEKSFHRDLLHAHFTASALILNKGNDKVLLIHHNKLDKWLQPGGHADGETDLLKVALKEVEEETGISSFENVFTSIFDLDIHEIPASKKAPAHLHYDVRFLMIAKNEREVRINHESKAFRWVGLDEIHHITKEPSIVRMVDKSKNYKNRMK